MNKSKRVSVVLLLICAASASATRVIDVNDSSMVLSGDTVSLEATENGAFPDPRNIRFSSVEKTNTDRTAVVLSNEGGISHYFKWALINMMLPADYRYAQIHYRINPVKAGDFSGDALMNRLRLETSNEAEDWDDFSNPERIDGSVGAHSFIIDLHADKTYSGHWTALRWDFFNCTGNAGKSITIDKVVFGRKTASVASSSLGLICR